MKHELIFPKYRLVNADPGLPSVRFASKHCLTRFTRKKRAVDWPTHYITSAKNLSSSVNSGPQRLCGFEMSYADLRKILCFGVLRCIRAWPVLRDRWCQLEIPAIALLVLELQKYMWAQRKAYGLSLSHHSYRIGPGASNSFELFPSVLLAFDVLFFQHNSESRFHRR